MSKPYPLVDGKKRCPKCNTYKELSEYHKDKNRAYGVVAICKACVKTRHSFYYLENKETIRKQHDKYYKENKEVINEYGKKLYIKRVNEGTYKPSTWPVNHPEEAKAYHDKWCKENKDKCCQYTTKWRKNHPDQTRIYKKGQYQRYKQDIQFVLSGRMANGIRHSLKNVESKANRKWDTLVDFTPIQLKEHLESQFDENMSWDNYGSYWHIDHKIPIAAFNFETPEDIDFKRCWSLDNLQPLNKIENMRKNDHVDTPFQPSLAIAV